jgi:hypothetical protein
VAQHVGKTSEKALVGVVATLGFTPLGTGVGQRI